MGDSCDCPEGFSGTYCEMEGVLFVFLLAGELVSHILSLRCTVSIHPQPMNHMSHVTVPATTATVTTPVVHVSAILFTLESTATKP